MCHMRCSKFTPALSTCRKVLNSLCRMHQLPTLSVNQICSISTALVTYFLSLHCVSKKVVLNCGNNWTNLNQFSKFFHCWKDAVIFQQNVYKNFHHTRPVCPKCPWTEAASVRRLLQHGTVQLTSGEIHCHQHYCRVPAIIISHPVRILQLSDPSLRYSRNIHTHPCGKQADSVEFPSFPSCAHL